VTRRLRLALLLAALVVSGPMPSVRAADAARIDVSIAWFRSERVVSPSREPSNATVAGPATTREFSAHQAPHLSTPLLSYSQFQRPPPLSN
jgi:hypothetical protein